MDAQDIADEQRLVRFARRGDDALGGLQRVGERLLAEYMRARLKRFDRRRRVLLGIDANRDGVGFESMKRFGQALEPGQAGELALEIMARPGVAGAKAHEL